MGFFSGKMRKKGNDIGGPPQKTRETCGKPPAAVLRSAPMETAIGTLETLRRYPVKSMAGEDLARAHVAFTGLTGDRVWAFVRGDKKPDFPWHSAREQHDMLLYRPRYVEPTALAAAPYPLTAHFAVRVRTPRGAEHAIDDAALLAELQAHADAPVALRFSEKGMPDARPLSIFGLSTLAALAAETGRPIDGRRFRANFYARWRDEAPFYEDGLVGKRLRIGTTLEIAIVKKDPRCVIIGLDPDAATMAPEVLRNVAKKHAGCAGVYAAVLREGDVAAGDPIVLLG